MVVRISDKTQNYSKVTKLLVKPNILRRRAMNAGVTVGGKNTIHGIRRMVATEMIKANQSVYTVSQILGHQSLKSTRQYIDLDVEGLRKCTLCFNDVIGDER